MTPKISVIIPVYNVSEYLDKCLWSVTNQTFRDIEIIAVNDGSTDDSLSVIERYAAQDSRIKIINKQNEGVVLARKVGLDISSGDYIHYLDGDDYLELNTYELLYKKAIEQDSDMTFMKFWFEGETKLESKSYNTQQTSLDMLKQISRTTEYYSVWQYIHKRQLYKNNILFDKNLSIGEDAYLTTQLIYYAKNISFVNTPLYHYITRPTSITNRVLSDKKKKNFVLYPKLIIDFFKDKSEFKIVEKELSIRYVTNIAYCFHIGYLKNGHQTAKIAIRILRKYPELKNAQPIKPMLKLIKLYAINGLLGRIYAQYYIQKGKIKK